MAGRLEQMKDEIQKKEFEVKRLHSELNKTAASLMKAEMEVYKLISSLQIIWGYFKTKFYNIVPR